MRANQRRRCTQKHKVQRSLMKGRQSSLVWVQFSRDLPSSQHQNQLGFDYKAGQRDRSGTGPSSRNPELDPGRRRDKWLFHSKDGGWWGRGRVMLQRLLGAPTHPPNHHANRFSDRGDRKTSSRHS